MSQASDMLRRFDGTSTYADLQQVFVQLIAEAEEGRENTELAAKMDEVVERLIRERARDERELNDVQARYGSFREQNRGIVGWVKRHLPFTKTRRQELGHQGELADQSAEVLADNLIIARVQMLKERILPPQHRRLGLRITDWQAEWERNRHQIRDAAMVLVRMHVELGPSQSFVSELQKEIDAFASARFQSESDVVRRDIDLEAARRELGFLKQEIAAEQVLKSASSKLVVDQIAAELQISDSHFRHAGEHLQILDIASERMNELRASFAKLVATVGQFADSVRQVITLPEELQQARQAIARLEIERSDAERVISTKTHIVHEREIRMADSQRAVDQARQMLASLQPSYDAYLAQRAASASMPQIVEAEPLAPIAQQYQTARGALDQSETQSRESKSSLEAARRDVTQSESIVRTVDEKLATERKKLSDLENKEPQLHLELANYGERGQREFAAAAAALTSYLHLERTNLQLPEFRSDEIAEGSFALSSPRRLELGLVRTLFSSPLDATRLAQATHVLEGLVKWQENQQRHWEQERSQVRSRRDSMWKRRCSELLGDELAEEACRNGLPLNKK